VECRFDQAQKSLSSQEIIKDVRKLSDRKVECKGGNNLLCLPQPGEAVESKLIASSLNSQRAVSQAELASVREEDAKFESSEDSETFMKGMKSGQIEEENKTCCSKAEVLLVDDVLFNLLPLKAIIENKFKRKCDEAVNGLIAVKM